jgi:hypothetical protein
MHRVSNLRHYVVFCMIGDIDQHVPLFCVRRLAQSELCSPGPGRQTLIPFATHIYVRRRLCRYVRQLISQLVLKMALLNSWKEPAGGFDRDIQYYTTNLTLCIQR